MTIREISPSKALIPGLSKHWHKPERTKACVRCGETLPLTDFSPYRYITRQGKQSTRYESRCKPCAAARTRARTLAKPGRNAELSRAWKERHPGYCSEYARTYRETEGGRLTKNRLQRIRKARQRAGARGVEEDPRIRDLYRQATELELLSRPCPVFALRELGWKMHVDHIIPLAKGGKHAFENLQILPSGLNMRKGAS